MTEPDQVELGKRIRDARQSKGLTAEHLGELVELGPSAMSRLEAGIRSIKSTELARIAEALGVSVMAILDPSSLPGRLQISPRGDQRVVDPTTTRTDAVMRRLQGFAELSSLVGNFNPPRKLLLAEAKPGDRWYQTTDRQAAVVREALGFSVDGACYFSDIASAIELKLGVDVVVESHPDGLIGATIADPDCPLIFVNSEQPMHRARFTLAHELFHYLESEGSGVVYDTTLAGQSEKFANAFAAGFLMPVSGLQAVIRDYGRTADALGHMMHRFGVSYRALVYRLHNGGLIRADGRDTLLGLRYSGLLDSISDETLAHQLQELQTASPGQRRPTRLTGRVLQAFREGRVSVRPLADLLDEDPRSVSELFASPQDPVEGDFADDYSYGDGPSEPNEVELERYYSDPEKIDRVA